MGRKGLIILLACFLAVPVLSQVTEAGASIHKKDSLKFDTTRYKKYSERFIVALYQSTRQYDISFDQKFTKDDSTSVGYFADAKTVTGVEVDFDKITLSVGFRSTPPKDQSRKGKTTYINYGLSIGGNKWFIETSYRKFKGFYAANSSEFIKNFSDSLPFYQNNSFLNESIKAKFFYFTNHRKFSYKSSYGCNHRQLKSAASLVISGNVYYNRLKTDTSFFPSQLWPFYADYSDFNDLKVIGGSVGGGFSFNIVLWRSLFFNLTGVLNGESQWRTYDYFSKSGQLRTYLSASGDVRVAFGFNAKNFFVTFSSFNDFVYINSGQVKITSKFISGNFTIGYRFKAKTPGWYKKIQQTKLYNLF